MKIGNLNIKKKLFLAPMCDVTSLPFRLICKKYGAAIVYTEMINADAYIMESARTKKRAHFLEEERPIGIQIVGSDIQKLQKAAIKVEKELNPDIIDINLGCPAYNVMKTGSGSSILKDIRKLALIVNTISSSIEIPLTCKIRILPDDNDTLKAAKIIEKSGAALLTVHGRTAGQGYGGKANWNIIKQIKDNLNIPVVLNGDIIDEESAKKAFDISGCDAIMIGRAAIGNPYIFRRIDYYLKTGKKVPELELEERFTVLRQILDKCIEYEYTNIKTIKLLAHNTVKGFYGSKTIKRKINETRSLQQIYELFD